MKAVKTQIGIVLSFILFLGCTQNNHTKVDLGSICFEEDWNIDSMAQRKEYRLVYVFDGNCSLCVMNLLELQSILESSLYKFSICPVFIAKKSDYDILSYNLERVNFKYNIIYDSLDVFHTKNKKLDVMDNNFFLLEKNNKILLRSKSISEIALRNYLTHK